MDHASMLITVCGQIHNTHKSRNTGDYESDFDAIVAASGSKIVRGYAASDCNAAQQILPAAKVGIDAAHREMSC